MGRTPLCAASAKLLEQFRHRLSSLRILPIACDLRERFEHEQALTESRVRHAKRVASEDRVAVQDEIEIERARCARPRTFSSPLSFDPKQLIGLEANEVRGLVGKPNEVRDGRPATVWAYRSGSCALEVYFYLDLGSQKLRALAYDLTSAGRTTDQRAIAVCADQFRAEFRDGKR